MNTWFTLELQPSGSGAKYLGVGGESFWEHHGEALYRERNNSPEVRCKQEVIG
jgi:Membrane-bound lysozyme-inhibitor of c-type lysozyme